MYTGTLQTVQFIPYTGTLQTAHSYTVYSYNANSTNFNRIQAHCKHHTFITYAGTLQTVLIYTSHRYTAKTTHLYRLPVRTPVECKQHTFIPIPVHCKQQTVIPYTGTL